MWLCGAQALLNLVCRQCKIWHVGCLLHSGQTSRWWHGVEHGVTSLLGNYRPAGGCIQDSLAETAAGCRVWYVATSNQPDQSAVLLQQAAAYGILCWLSVSGGGRPCHLPKFVQMWTWTGVLLAIAGTIRVQASSAHRWSRVCSHIVQALHESSL